MVKRYKTASSRIEFPVYQQYVAKLAEKGKTPNEDLKTHIEEVLKDERTEKRPSPRDSDEHRQQVEEPRVEARTLSFGGKTYTIEAPTPAQR